MASTSTNPPAVKLSFAKVAASANTPRVIPRPTDKAATQSQGNAQQPRTDHGKERTIAQPGPPTAERTSIDVPKVPAKVIESTTASKKSSRLMPIPIVRPMPEISPATPSSVSPVRQQAFDDGSTQVSSSIGPTRQGTFDSKSVASTTTFAMDEKESLWPDDSASIRAREDEESSALGTGAAESRVGSDTEARAFSDQLREISTMAPHPVPVDQLTPSTGTPSGVPYGTGLVNPVSSSQLISGTRANAVLLMGPDVIPIPDEKLMEALASHRDRLFVLKLEQDIIDFVKDSQESQMKLPQTNSFYRMLAHKLADYYLLNHTVDTNDTGSAVVIIRAGATTFPPPLHAIPTSALTNPPPVAVSGARRIMRRGGVEAVDGIITASPSEGPSKATSEAGDGSGSSDLNPDGTKREKSKKAITREEREAKYKEARERIFGNTVDADVNGPDNASGDVEMSRSSSGAGRKKQIKKQRVPINDEFESRTQFAASMYAQQFGQDGVMDKGQYPPYPGAMINAGYGPVAQPLQAMYGPGLPMAMSPIAGPGHYPLPSHDNTGGSVPPPGYDLSTHFQQSMQFSGFADASSPSQVSLNMMSPDVNNIASQASSPMQALPPQWHPMSPYQQYYGPPQPGMMSPVYTQQQAMQMPVMMNSSYGMPSGQHPSFQQGAHRASFNPQTQSFIPNMHIGHPQMTSARMPQFTAPMNSNTNQRSYNSSPQGAYNSPRLHNAAPPSLPPNPMVYPINPRTPLQAQFPAQQQQPSPKYAGSSIAKWGTPAHLPPKPPAPTTVEGQKTHE